MIPLRDESQMEKFPFVTLGLIFFNLFVFLWEVSLGPRLDKTILLFGVIPERITHLESPLELITLFTSLFLHADFFHLAGNMLYLWVFGNNIEDRLGHSRFFLLYLICGVISGLSFSLIVPDSKLPMIGASGAVSGVLGAYFLLYPDAKITVLLPLFFFWKTFKVRAFWFLLLWIGLQFFFAISGIQDTIHARGGGVAWLAHILGFIAGAFLLTLFLKEKDSRSFYR